MDKRIINPGHQDEPVTESVWLDIESLVRVEITSEDAAHPIEAALRPSEDCGWRAAGPGRQTIRLRFNHPQPLQRIWLKFVEADVERTQEYELRWSDDGGQSFHHIVRQQWNFSPSGATAETEDHHVDLPAVNVLELNIVPEIRGGEAIASLMHWRLA